MIRTALYIRVSTEEQAIHGLSLDAQQSALTEYAEKHNLTIVGIYRDEGTTARKKLSQRKQFQELIKAVEADKIDLILVTKLDRWFRNIRDYYNTQDILEKHNCNWKTIFEEYDTSTAGGRLHINIMLSINQDECDRTSERIKAVQAHKLEQLEAISGKVPYGYKLENKKIVKDKEVQPIMEDYWQHLLTYHSVRGATKYINDKYSLAINYSTAKRFSQNEVYAGIKRGIEGFCEPYLSKAQFDEVRAIIGSKNIRVRATNKSYIFSNLLRCPNCGGSMAGHTYNKANWSDYYICSTAHNNKLKCNNTHSYNADKLYKSVVEVINTELNQYVVELTAVSKKAKIVNTQKKKEVLKKKLQKLKELYLNELITLEEFKEDKKNFENQLLELESQPTEDYTEQIKKAQQMLELDIPTVIKDMSDKDKNALLMSVIDYIVPTDPPKIVFKKSLS